MFQPIVLIFGIILMFFGSPFSIAQESKAPAKTEKTPPSASPVVLGDQVLFNVPAELGYKGLTSEGRARSISEKIKSIAEIRYTILVNMWLVISLCYHPLS